MNYEYRFGGEEYSVSVDKAEEGYKVTVGDTSFPLKVTRIDSNTYLLTSDNGSKRLLHIAHTDGKVYLQMDGRVHVLEDVLADEDSGGGAAASDIVDGVQKVIAPMPGKLVKVTVSEGEKVTKGMTVCIVEAMKMENVVQARLDGVVKNIAFEPGDLVDTDKPILEVVSED